MRDRFVRSWEYAVAIIIHYISLTRLYSQTKSNRLPGKDIKEAFTTGVGEPGALALFSLKSGQSRM